MLELSDRSDWVEIWVGIAQLGALAGVPVIGADVPEGVRPWIRNSLPPDLIRPGTGLAVTHASVFVHPDDVVVVEKAGKRVSESSVSEHDKLFVRMMRECGKDWQGKADAFFDSIPDISTSVLERKEMAVELLEQARYRGLSEKKELEIAERLALTDVEIEDSRGVQP